MKELEAERKKLLAQSAKIANETRAAKKALDKANADYFAADAEMKK